MDFHAVDEHIRRLPPVFFADFGGDFGLGAEREGKEGREGGGVERKGWFHRLFILRNRAAFSRTGTLFYSEVAFVAV